MATNQNSNKESGAETTKKASASTKKTGTRTSTTRTASSRPVTEKKGPGRPAGSTSKTAATSKTATTRTAASGRASASERTSTASRTTAAGKTAVKAPAAETKTATRASTTRTASTAKTTATAKTPASTRTASATKTASTSRTRTSAETGSKTQASSVSNEPKSESTYTAPSFYSASSLFADEASSSKTSLYDTTESAEIDSQTSYASTQGSTSQFGSSQIPDDLIYSSPNDNGFEEPDEQDDDKDSSKKWPIILTVTGVILLLGLGGFLIANRTDKNKTEKNPVNTRLEVNEKERGALVRDQAQKYIFDGEYDQAISLLTSYLAENGDDAEAQQLLEQARNRKALQETPGVDILSAYNSYIAAADYSGAVRLIEGADEDELIKQGLDKDALLNKARTLENARNMMNRNDYDGAEKTLEKYLADNKSSDPDVTNLLDQVRRLQAIVNPSNDYEVSQLPADRDRNSNQNLVEGNDGNTSSGTNTGTNAGTGNGQSDVPAFVGMNTPQTNRSSLIASNGNNSNGNNGLNGTGTGTQGNNTVNNASNSGTGNNNGSNAGNNTNGGTGSNAGTNNSTGNTGNNTGTGNRTATSGTNAGTNSGSNNGTGTTGRNTGSTNTPSTTNSGSNNSNVNGTGNTSGSGSGTGRNTSGTGSSGSNGNTTGNTAGNNAGNTGAAAGSGSSGNNGSAGNNDGTNNGSTGGSKLAQMALQNGYTGAANKGNVGADGTSTSPEILVRRYGKRAITRAEALDVGQDYIDDGKYDEAINLMKELLTLNPQDQKARELLEKAQELKRKNGGNDGKRSTDQNLDLAKRWLDNENYDDAIAMLKSILEKDPNNAEAKKLLEEALAKKNGNDLNEIKKNIANGDYDKAIAALQDILKKDPNNAEAKKLLEQALAAKNKADADNANKLTQAKKDLANGDYDKAIAALQDILKKDPNNAEAKKLLEQAQAAKAKAKADADLAAKLAQAKKDIENGNYDKAISALNDILKKDPNNAEAKKLLEQAQAAKAKAKADADKANKLAQAQKDINSGNYDKAIAALNEILKDDPNNVVAKQLLAQATAGKDRVEKEKAAKEKAAAELKAKLDQAKKDIAAGNYDKAIAALNEILKEDPNNAEAKQLLNQALNARNKAANEKATNLTNARNALNNGNYDDAIAALNKVLADDPNNAEAKKLLEQAQNKKQQEADRNNKLAQAKKDAANGNYDDAIAALNQILKNNPNDADARALLSQVTAAKNKLDAENKAKENELANQKAKQAVENSIAKGKEALAKGNVSEALKHFDDAKNSLPANDNDYAAEKLGDMAKTLYDASTNQGNPQTKATLASEAVKDANAALAKNSKNAPSHYVLGMQAMDAKNYATAEKEFKLATENDPKNSVYWYQLGRAQAMQSKFDAAATSFKTSISLNSKYAPAHYNLGYVSEKAGNKTQALASYQDAYKIDPNYERAYLASGRLMAADGNYSGAIKEFDKAIAINPSNAQTYQEQGSAYSNIGNYKSAETAYKKALAYMDPSKPDPATYYNISTVLYAQGKDTEAYTYAKQAYDNKASAAKSLQVNCIYNYGLLCETTGKKDQAMSLYEEALTLDNKHVKSKINIGALYLEKGDVDTALAFLNSAYAQDKNNFEANNNLGNAYAQKGDYVQAVTYYQNALKINPKDNTVRENLAKAYATSGQYQSAKVTYEDVIASDPENWSAYLELAKVDISLGDTEDAIEKLTYLQTHNPSYMRTEVSSLLYTLR